MTKRQRTLLWSILVVMFLGFTPTLILYSQGYRFDFASKKITQTGGFYLKVNPGRADIFINSVFKQKTDFVFNSAFISNLLPKSYMVRVSKEGYMPYSKILAVKPKEVTEAKNILLVPSHIEFRTLFGNVKNFWPSPGAKKVILQKAGSGNISQFYAWDVGDNNQQFLFKQNAENITDIFWSQDSSKILVKNSVWNVTGNTNDPCAKTACNAQSFVKANPNVVFLTPQKVHNDAAKLDTAKKLQTFIDPLTTVVPNPDKRKIALIKENSVWVYYGEDQNDQPVKKAGDMVLLASFNKKPQNLIWLTTDHLLFSVGNAIKVSEIDDRDSLNVVNLISYQNPKLFWQDQNKTLTVLSEGNLFVSEKLIP